MKVIGGYCFAKYSLLCELHLGDKLAEGTNNLKRMDMTHELLNLSPLVPKKFVQKLWFDTPQKFFFSSSIIENLFDLFCCHILLDLFQTFASFAKTTSQKIIFDNF